MNPRNLAVSELNLRFLLGVVIISLKLEQFVKTNTDDFVPQICLSNLPKIQVFFTVHFNYRLEWQICLNSNYKR